jgi:LPXTG-motif cell wall-anchored protein
LRALTAQDSYQVAFDLAQKSSQWWFPAVGLILLIAGAVMIWLGRRKHWPLSRRVFGYFMAVLACVWSAFAFSRTYGEYASLRSDYRKGQFSIVEGQVTNFHPMPYESHQDERFSVQAQTFCYSDYVITGGFRNTASAWVTAEDAPDFRSTD